MEALEERLRAAEEEGRAADELRMECRRLEEELKSLRYSHAALEVEIVGLKEEKREDAGKYDALVDELNGLHATVRRPKEEDESHASGGGDAGVRVHLPADHELITLMLKPGSRVTIDVGPS